MTPTPERNRSPIPDGPIVLFDGVCNLCHSSVRWIIRRDPTGIFRFASLQSNSARTLLASGQRDASEAPATMLLLENGIVWAKSDAWLRIVKRLGPGWSWLSAAGVLPKCFRDGIYDFVAAHRYQWFGKKDRDTCPLPDKSLQNRFLD